MSDLIGEQSRGSKDEVTFWSVSGQKLGDYHLNVVPAVGPPQPQSTQFYATQTGTNYYFGGKLIKNSGGWVCTDRMGSNGKYYSYGGDSKIGPVGVYTGSSNPTQTESQ